MTVTLLPHQTEVLDRLSSGKILYGGVGSGKSLVALSYYFHRELIGDIIVITTAKKRDSLEWETDAAKLGIGSTPGKTLAGILTVDSWNNIHKYTDRRETFFIFDEQRLIGSGAWVKAFYRIAANGNPWLILSATPGDTWMDYIPVFVANGFYKNKTEFIREHVVYRPFTRYPQIMRYLNETKLEALKREVLVAMPYESTKIRKHIEIPVTYNVEMFNRVYRDRWNIYEDKPIQNASELFAVMRRVVYSDRSRLVALRTLMTQYPRLIVFYNFNYELDLLRELNDTWSDLFTIAEWNGHKHEVVPTSDNWVYLVQYSAGAEGWNCTSTNTMVFYSLTYSYKQYIQAQGRIDRLDTYYQNVFYFSLFSQNLVDRAVKRALSEKKDFNERRWADDHLPVFE